MKGKNMDEFSQIMQDVLNEIKSTLDTAPSSFKLWFGELRLVALDDSSATFVTTTDLKKNILNNKYKDIITLCLKNTIGFEVRVPFSPRTSTVAQRLRTERSLPRLRIPTISAGNATERTRGP